MSNKDEGRQWIDRNVTVPVVSHDWAANFDDMVRGNATDTGLIDEWRKVRERIIKRRSKNAVGSNWWKACEMALGFVRWINKHDPDWFDGEAVMTHNILERVATLQERLTGKIDAQVQAVMRDAMLETYDIERHGR